MIYELLKESRFPGDVMPMGGGSELSVRVEGTRKPLLGTCATYRVSVLYYVGDRNVDFGKAAACVLSRVGSLSGGRPARVEADWIMVGEGIGIYAFEGMAVREHIRYRGMANAFCTIDLYDGTTFYKPGHDENYVVSRRFERLVSDYAPGREDATRAGFAEALGLVLARLDESRRFGAARRIVFA